MVAYLNVLSTFLIAGVHASGSSRLQHDNCDILRSKHGACGTGTDGKELTCRFVNGYNQCAPGLQLHDSCNPHAQNECNFGLYCTGRRMCEPAYGEIGDWCPGRYGYSFWPNAECGNVGFCQDNVCRGFITSTTRSEDPCTGDTNNGFVACASPLYCQPDATAGTCLPRRGLNEACNTPKDCADGLTCFRFTCKVFSGINQICDQDLDCAGSMQCAAYKCVPRDGAPPPPAPTSASFAQMSSSSPSVGHLPSFRPSLPPTRSPQSALRPTPTVGIVVCDKDLDCTESTQCAASKCVPLDDFPSPMAPTRISLAPMPSTPSTAPTSASFAQMPSNSPSVGHLPSFQPSLPLTRSPPSAVRATTTLDIVDCDKDLDCTESTQCAASKCVPRDDFPSPMAPTRIVLAPMPPAVPTKPPGHSLVIAIVLGAVAVLCAAAILVVRNTGFMVAGRNVLGHRIQFTSAASELPEGR